MIFDALSVLRRVREAAYSTRDQQGSTAVSLASRKVSAPQLLSFEIYLDAIPSAPRATLELTLELEIELEFCRLTLSKGAMTAVNVGTAVASAELKYKNSVVVPKCRTPAIALGKKTLKNPIVIPLKEAGRPQ